MDWQNSLDTFIWRERLPAADRRMDGRCVCVKHCRYEALTCMWHHEQFFNPVSVPVMWSLDSRSFCRSTTLKSFHTGRLCIHRTIVVFEKVRDICYFQSKATRFSIRFSLRIVFDRIQLDNCLTFNLPTDKTLP